MDLKEQEQEEEQEEQGRKCLWRRNKTNEEEEDNVTDEETFLKSLRVAPRPGPWGQRYGAAVHGALPVGERVAVVCALAGVFAALRRGTVSAALVLGVDALLAAVLLALAHGRRAAPALRPLAAAGASTLALAPALQSLTAAFSSDSVYLAATLLLILHAYAFRYSNTVAGASSPSVVALNAALFASVLLASRLTHGAAQAAAFLLYATLVFGVLPAARPRPARTPAATAAVLALLSLCNVLLWAPTHPAALVLYAALLAVVILVAPLFLVLVQPLKRFVFCEAVMLLLFEHHLF